MDLTASRAARGGHGLPTYGACAVHPALTSGTAGKVISKIDPWGLDLARTRLPSYLSTIVRQIARPNPIPAGLVVKNASNMWFWSCGGTPAPVSWTDRRTDELPSRRTPTFNRRPSDGVAFMASTAFMTMLRITCCNCAGSTDTEGVSPESSVVT